MPSAQLGVIAAGHPLTAEVGAEGIVGVQLHERNHGWGSHVIEFFAVGTAIVPFGEAG